MRREAHLVENEFVKGEWQSELAVRHPPARVARGVVTGRQVCDNRAMGLLEEPVAGASLEARSAGGRWMRRTLAVAAVKRSSDRPVGAGSTDMAPVTAASTACTPRR